MNIANVGEGWNLARWNLVIFLVACAGTFLIGADGMLVG